MLNSKTAFLSALVLALSLGLAACGDDDGDGGDGGDGGGGSVDSGKQLSELSGDEANALCSSIEAGVDLDAAQRLSCAFAAAFSSMDEASCQTAFDACLAEPFEAEESDCPVENEIDDSCTATVAELEACVDEVNAALKSVADGFSCAEELDLTALEPGEACTAFDEKCPGVINTGE